jgi:hypothetical protein
MVEDRCLEERTSHDTAAERHKRAGMASFRPHSLAHKERGQQEAGENSTEVEMMVT